MVEEVDTKDRAMESADQANKQFEKIMLDKLVKGMKAGGKFSRVKIDKRDEKESCVYRLGDFSPEQFMAAKKRELNHAQMSARRKTQMKKEIERSYRLDGKLQQVVKVAKKRLAGSPAGMQAFKKIVDDLQLKGADDSDSDDQRWDINKEMRKFRANSKHQKVADQRLREKLVRMKRIKDVKDLKHVDSVLESAYNSTKALEWGKIKDRLDDPCPSFISEEEYDLFDESENSMDSRDESVDVETQIKREGRVKMNPKGNNPLDLMKMAMLGFEAGFVSANTSALIASIKSKIAELNNIGTVIPEDTQEVIYKRLCDEF